MDTLEVLSEHKWTTPDSYAGYNPTGDYCIYAKNRDSSLLEQSNFTVILEQIEKLDPDNEYHHTFSASHWACGWVEYLIVDYNAPDNILKYCAEILCALSDYPVISEDHYSDLQYNEIYQYWERMSLKERIEYCLDNEESIFAARHDHMPQSIYEDIEQIFG